MNIEKSKETISNQLSSSNYIRWAILLFVTLIFVLILYPNIVVNKNFYKIGDIAKRDIKSSKDFFIEDNGATNARCKRAVNAVIPIYDYDTNLSVKLCRNVKNAFAELREIYEKEKNDNTPTTSDVISLPEKTIPEKTIPEKTIPEKTAIFNSTVSKKLWNSKEKFEKKIGISISNGAYLILVREKVSEDIATYISKILSAILKNGVVSNKDILLKNVEKGIILRNVETKAEEVVHNLKRFYGLDQAKTMVRIIGHPILNNINYNLRNLIVDFVQRLIQPNITFNRNKTEERKSQAAKKIKPVMYKVKADEMILREGERVTENILLKLEVLKLEVKKKQLITTSLGAAGIIFTILLIGYVLHIKDNTRFCNNQNKNLLFIASVLVVSLIIAKISASFSESLVQNLPLPVPALSMPFSSLIASGSMLICIFLFLDTAVAFAAVSAVCVAVIFHNRFEVFLYCFLNGSMAAYWVQNCRERKVFIKAGLKLGFLNILLVTTINFYLADFSFYQLLWGWALSFIGGLIAGIITSGIAPLVEIAFGYTTDIKLLELANLESPILRRLMIESPGTYHHSMVVGSMVEAAASEIGANPLLAKVCGYYHDIGKLKQPLYFVENQVKGKNKHDKLAPSMSSLILIAHVKNGVEFATQNKLGQDIIDTIRQHHGTSLIKFFYDKAKQLKGEGGVNINNFRYPGPKPQTREAGLVMLADVVEAASRTIDNPTPSRIQGLVQNLINKVFSDGQLENCELTLKDLHKIAKIFIKILTGIHHHRIEYSENLSTSNGKKKNGSTDKQQTNQTSNKSGKNSEEDKGHLKRLGLS